MTPLDCCSEPRHSYLRSIHAYKCRTCGASWTLDEYSELVMNERAETLAAEYDDDEFDDPDVGHDIAFHPGY